MYHSCYECNKKIQLFLIPSNPETQPSRMSLEKEQPGHFPTRWPLFAIGLSSTTCAGPPVPGDEFQSGSRLRFEHRLQDLPHVLRYNPVALRRRVYLVRPVQLRLAAHPIQQKRHQRAAWFSRASAGNIFSKASV